MSNDSLLLGIDIGSTTVKAVVLDPAKMPAAASENKKDAQNPTARAQVFADHRRHNADVRAEAVATC